MSYLTPTETFVPGEYPDTESTDSLFALPHCIPLFTHSWKWGTDESSLYEPIIMLCVLTAFDSEIDIDSESAL
jgi:hypothetical protein